jgi:hypothetical protein
VIDRISAAIEKESCLSCKNAGMIVFINQNLEWFESLNE